ncbi:bacillithiol biosynthesis cysteine-adding enzyme BshC [Bacillus sp. M6-12]|uniref:bacillithiol biosynthesis cysteine-adding enzyme BshC n=1 Tax=Bacillus sp. M6-12 TaxID=2054166 RepID=UPI000C7844AA|nr:bacillithiol biosynthesis cysteine-adding enzyme BshC [Bacillus sp. M6-12]PLS16584.1 bacillithiol biosynthesis cysteine-adding enzyme BshC [Bacillus sp. M6-12]
MEIKNLALPAMNRFASDYLNGMLEAGKYFHYDLTDDNLYQARYDDLASRSFQRQELADYIYEYMNDFGMSEAAASNIEALRKEGSAVVIGGQQAGLLSGPLYTIHKIISIIKLAEQQTRALNQTVVPVFWIAGEDHDLPEVNHIYAMGKNKPEKMAYPLYQPKKTMVSDTPLDSKVAAEWTEAIFETFGETDYTSNLLAETKHIIEASGSFTDFFTNLINLWFKDYGLLLMDAADPRLRKIESGYFQELIEHSQPITSGVLTQQSAIEEAGYSRAIELEKDAANLFYYDPERKERILLIFDSEANIFKCKNMELSFTEAELLEIARNNPERLSNNVVTRPIMQEKLFPVLAFISGPGEIAYWAELKLGFEVMGMKMPPIVPRLNITILERGISTDLDETGLELSEVLLNGTEAAEARFLESVKDTALQEIYEKTKEQLAINHKQLAEKGLLIDSGLKPLLSKNSEFLQGQLDFIYEKIMQSTRRNHEIILTKYSRIGCSLFPLKSPQERIWNIFYYLNKYGPDFIGDLMELEYEFNNQHKIVII